MAGNSTQTFGVKITAAQREYYRYTGVSEDVERRGRGPNSEDFQQKSNSRPEKVMTSGKVNERNGDI